MKKLALVCGLLLLAFTVAFGASRVVEDSVPVDTATVQRGSLSAYITAAGNVVNREELAIVSPVSAQVSQLSVDEGAHVAANQVLVRFDDRSSAIQNDKARAQLELAEQKEGAARRQLDTLSQLFMLGGETRTAVEDAQLKLRTAQTERTVAIKEVALARLQGDQFQVRAPAAGTLTARAVRNGAWVKAGDTLFKLAPAGSRAIEVRLDAGDSAAVAPGKPVSVTSDAFPGKEWQETITWVAPATSKDGTANSLTVRVSLGDQAPALVQGQQVDVKLVIARRRDVLLVPSSAILSRHGAAAVPVAVDGRVQSVPVSTGLDDLRRTEITAGLREGQQIILSDGKSLKDGDKVTLTPGRAQP